MDISQFLTTAQDAITVRRVFAEPYEKDGITVITAARVAGGGGGQGPKDAQPGQKAPEGEGAGFGMNASPAGAFVIKDGNVRWVPAIDPGRILGAVATVLVALVLTRGWVLSRAIKAGQQT